MPPADKADHPIVEIHQLRKSFGANEVLKGIDLQVARGEVRLRRRLPVRDRRLLRLERSNKILTAADKSDPLRRKHRAYLFNDQQRPGHRQPFRTTFGRPMHARDT